MNILEPILNHRSIRRYKNTPIPAHIIQSILDAAIRGSNTGNMQLYSIIVTQDAAKKEALLPCHFKQSMILEAPLVLTFCADVHRFNKWCEARNATPHYNNFLWYTNACIDAVIAAQNAAIAAEAHDLGICYLGTTTYMADKIIEVLQLPHGVIPITTLVVGYPNDTPPLTDRLPHEAIIHHETYTNYTPESINTLYAEKEALPFTKQLIEENQTPSLAHVFTEKRYKKADNELFSEKYLTTLKTQGFI